MHVPLCARSNVTRSKQQYLPSTNILSTKFLSDEGVGQVDDFMPLPASKSDKSFLPWLVRTVTTIRGELEFNVVSATEPGPHSSFPLILPPKQECAPAFNYARSSHETKIDNAARTADFTCPEHVDLDLRWVVADSDHPMDEHPLPEVKLDLLDLSDRGHQGCAGSRSRGCAGAALMSSFRYSLGVTTKFKLYEGQKVTFVLREPPTSKSAGETSGEGPKHPSAFEPHFSSVSAADHLYTQLFRTERRDR